MRARYVMRACIPYFFIFTFFLHFFSPASYANAAHECACARVSIYIDEQLQVKNIDYSDTTNATHHLFTLTYEHSISSIEIVATEVIPEFPSWTILLIFMTLTLTIAISKKRIKRKISKF
jgi:hypothetical protein